MKLGLEWVISDRRSGSKKVRQNLIPLLFSSLESLWLQALIWEVISIYHLHSRTRTPRWWKCSLKGSARWKARRRGKILEIKHSDYNGWSTLPYIECNFRYPEGVVRPCYVPRSSQLWCKSSWTLFRLVQECRHQSKKGTSN